LEELFLLVFSAKNFLLVFSAKKNFFLVFSAKLQKVFFEFLGQKIFFQRKTFSFSF